MKISVCTVTARDGFAEYQAMMLNKQTHMPVEWVLVDFAYEKRKDMIKDLSNNINLPIVHVANVRDDKVFFRDIARNRNRALQNASGDAVIFLDDYAIVNPDYVKSHVQILKEGCISCGTMWRLDRSIDDTVMENVLDADKLLALNKDEIGTDARDRLNGKCYEMRGGITYTGNLGIPRSVFDALNGFDPRMESGLEDCDLGIRCNMIGGHNIINPSAWTINLQTGNRPYVYRFDHAHDVEPFISNPNNNFRGDATLSENENMEVEFFGKYRIATCKKCGAKGMIDPNELIAYKLNNGEHRVPDGLSGGYR